MAPRIWLLARHEIGLFLRSRESLIWMFAMPLVFMIFTGLISGGGRRASGPRIALVVAAKPGPVTASLGAQLERLDYSVRVVPPGADTVAASFRLLVPDDFEERIHRKERAEVLLRSPGAGELSGRLHRARVQRAILRTLGDLVMLAVADSALTREALLRRAAIEPSIELEVSSLPARAATIPSGFDQSVPGTLVMFMMLVLMTGGAEQILTARRQGLLRRLASSPLRRSEIVSSHVVARTVVAMIMAGFAVIVGFAVGVDWGPHLPMVLLVLLVYSVALAGLGVLAGSVARSLGQAIGLGVVLSILMGALGGCWWPIEVTPRAMQVVALFLPTGWAMHGLHRLMELGRPPSSALPAILALGGFAVVFLVLAARSFRYH